MKSMTGFGRAESEIDGSYVSIEIKSFNHRFLDISMNQPKELSGLEHRIRSKITAAVGRGRVECSIRLRHTIAPQTIEFDEKMVQALVKSFTALMRDSGIETRIQLSDLLRYDDLLRRDPTFDIESIWDHISGTLSQALDSLEAERAREGQATMQALMGHRETVGGSVLLIQQRAQTLDHAITEQVRRRFDEVLGDRVDEDRVLAEVAAILIKCSIDEEVSRIRGHLEAIDEGLQSDRPTGKKLDFLCQELNREINTIGAKSPLFEINKCVVEAKDAIEKMREQLRNVE